MKRQAVFLNTAALAEGVGEIMLLILVTMSVPVSWLAGLMLCGESMGSLPSYGVFPSATRFGGGSCPGNGGRCLPSFSSSKCECMGEWVISGRSGS